MKVPRHKRHNFSVRYPSSSELCSLESSSCFRDCLIAFLFFEATGLVIFRLEADLVPSPQHQSTSMAGEASSVLVVMAAGTASSMVTSSSTVSSTSLVTPSNYTATVSVLQSFASTYGKLRSDFSMWVCVFVRFSGIA